MTKRRAIPRNLPHAPSGPRRLLPALALAVGLLATTTAYAQPEAEPEPEPEPAASSGGSGGSSGSSGSSASSGGSSSSGRSGGDGFLKKRGYLHLAPGIMALTLSTPSFPLYSWGVSGGIHLPVTGAFMIQVGGFFDHTTRGAAGFGSTHLFGIGPELRLGGGNQKIFGYGLVRLGAGISHVVFRDPTPEPDEPPVRRGTGASFLMTLGGGIQGLVHPNVALGGEPAFDVFAGGGGAAGVFRLRFFVAILF